jgi:anti-anti-sigma factor
MYTGGAPSSDRVRQMRPEDTLSPPGGVAIERHGDVPVVSLWGEHDVSTVDAVRERLAEAGAEPGLIVVDLVRAFFIDSSVAGALLEAYRRDSPPRMRFVAAPGTSPRALFTMLGFDGSVPIFERLEDALSPEPR